MNRGIRGLFIVLTVVIGLLAVFSGRLAADPPPAGPAALEERNEAVKRLAGLNEQERALVAELLDWDIRIEAARQDHDRLASEIPVVQQALADSEAGLCLAREQLSEGQDRLGRWVNYLYRNGPVAYLEVVLGSADFNDFVTRAESVKTIIISQVRLIDEVRELKGRQEEQAETLRQAQAELTAKTTALSQKLAEMEQAREGREAFLAELRQQSTVFAGKVVETETLLYQSISSLRYLLSHLDELPWASLAPEKFSLSGRGLRLEFSDQEINRVFFGPDNPELATLSVRSSREVFAISGSSEVYGTDFRMEGAFVLDGDGRVRFKPSRVLLAGLPVSGAVLDYIASERGLSVDLGNRTLGYRLTGIHSEEGKLVVELASS